MKYKKGGSVYNINIKSYSFTASFKEEEIVCLFSELTRLERLIYEL